MNYINYKDKKTKDTVLFIKKILSDLGIKTEEDYIANKRIGVSSVCIKIKDTEIGSNGKGINKISCLASGYAEFMERLQLRCLMQGTSLLSSLFTYSDRKFIEHTEIKDSIVFLSFKNKENIEKFMKNREKTYDNKTKLYRHLSTKGFSYNEISVAVSKYFSNID